MKKISKLLVSLILVLAIGLMLVGCESIPVDSVELDITSKSLKVGATVQLTATVTAPDEATDKTVSWSTSKSSVATVDSNGLVTAKGAGTATITATSKANSTKKATCEITVVDAVIHKAAGTYKVGTDIDAGEYLLVRTGTIDGYFQVTEVKDSNDILYNDNFVRTYVVLEDGLWIKVDRANIYTLDNDPGFTKNDNNGLPAGMYKVGKDLDAGMYIAQEISSSSTPYFEVRNTPHGDIEYNDNFSYRAFVELADGQYVNFSRCALYAESDAPAVVKNTDGSFKPGMYKVGATADVQPGSYTITRLTGSVASYSIYTDVTSTFPDSYVSVTGAAGSTVNVTLTEGTYIQLNNCTLKAN